MAKDDSDFLYDLHSQFADNQNHHQGLFVQLLTALFVLFGGFGYVYVHSDPTINYCKTHISVCSDVEMFSLSILHLTTVVVEGVLLLLNAIILHMGYSFRRDQHINMRIREYKLENYTAIFGNLYNPIKTNICEFLPDFHMIFFIAITASQVFIFIAVLIKSCCCKCCCQCCCAINAFLLLIIAGMMCCSLCLYCNTWSKYKKKIKKNCNDNDCCKTN
jgi:hypothetical protein